MQKVTIRPLPQEKAFPNSMKGQRGTIGDGGGSWTPGASPEYMRLCQMSFKWKDLERSKHDTVDRIREISNIRFADARKHNVRFIPRVAAVWPNSGDHTLATQLRSEFPDDMPPSTLDTPAFFSRVRDLIAKLGEAWNDDPRVAYIEMGI